MKKIIFFFLILFLTIIFFQLINRSNVEKKNELLKPLEENKQEKTTVYNSNIMKNVKYFSKDSKGNEFTILAKEGEIDLDNPNIIFLKEVDGLIKLIDSEKIIIDSNFGKYNTNNSSAIFSKNVKVNYLDNVITGEYLDFILERNTLIFSENIIFENPKNIVKSDVVEIDISTKNTKIYMFEENKKVNIKTKN